LLDQALSIVDILIAGKPPERRLPRQTDQFMAAIPAGAAIGERLARHRAETESVVEFAIGQQPGIGGDPAAIELKLHTAVEIEPERPINRFTRWVRHDGLMRFRITY